MWAKRGKQREKSLTIGDSRGQICVGFLPSMLSFLSFAEFCKCVPDLLANGYIMVFQQQPSSFFKGIVFRSDSYRTWICLLLASSDNQSASHPQCGGPSPCYLCLSNFSAGLLSYDLLGDGILCVWKFQLMQNSLACFLMGSGQSRM